MAENSIPKKNTAYTFYVALVDTASRPDLRANPTLAAGDVQVSTDGAAFGNLTTLPVVTPAGGVAVKVDLSAAEMNGDNVTVKFVDAAGAEWDDLLVEIRPATNKLEQIPTKTELFLDSGDAAGGAALSITLAATAPATNVLTNGWVYIYSGTGAGQTRMITSYDGTTKVATTNPSWTVNPVAGSKYVVLPAARVDLHRWRGVDANILVSGRVDASVGAMATNVLTETAINANAITAAKIATDAITADKIAADAIGSSELATSAVNEIVDQVWDEAQADHVAAGSFGLIATEIADVLTDTADMQPKLGTPAGADMSADIAAVKTDTAAILVDTADMQPKLGAPAGADMSADIAAVKTDTAATLVDTNELQGDWTDGGRLDLLLDRLITELDTARGEPGQGAPGVSEKIGIKIDYLYKAWRNRHTQTATQYSLYNDDATTIDHKATVSDDATTFDRTEVATGP